MSAMYPVLERLYKKGKLTDELWKTAISIGWITEEEKEKIINADI